MLCISAVWSRRLCALVCNNPSSKTSGSQLQRRWCLEHGRPPAVYIYLFVSFMSIKRLNEDWNVKIRHTLYEKKKIVSGYEFKERRESRPPLESEKNVVALYIRHRRRAARVTKRDIIIIYIWKYPRHYNIIMYITNDLIILTNLSLVQSSVKIWF